VLTLAVRNLWENWKCGKLEMLQNHKGSPPVRGEFPSKKAAFTSWHFLILNA